MRAVSIAERKLATAVVALLICTIMTLAVAIPASGIRPYGEQAILQRIDQEYSALCRKFGLVVTTPQYVDCMLALVDLRHRHVDLLVAYSWL